MSTATFPAFAPSATTHFAPLAYEQKPEAVKEWLDTTYPAIAKRAKAEGAEIHWADETAVANADGQTSTTITGAKTGLWYSVEYTGNLQTTEVWTEGDRAQAQADGSVTLDTPNAGARRSTRFR